MTEKKQVSRQTSILIVLAAALGGLLYGHDLGIIGPALLFLPKDIPMDTWHQGLLGGCVFAGGAIATLLSGFLADCFGRKRMLTVSAVIFCAGIILAASAHNFTELLTGRLTQGIAVGIVTIVTPLYLSESAPIHVRGRAVCAFQLLLTLSIMLGYLVGLYFTPTQDWRSMFLTALVPGLLFFFGSLSLPRSPHWLVMKNKLAEAKQVLAKTHTPSEAEREFGGIIHLQFSPKPELAYDTQKAVVWIPLAIVLVAAVLNQLTGINSLLQYGPIIFKHAGMSTQSIAIFSSTIITAANFLMTLLALFLVDKVGRRSLLLTGTIAITIALLLAGIVFGFMPEGSLRGTVFLISLIIFVLGFAIGPGVVIWLIISELLPDKIRSRGMSLALFLNSMASFLLASCYLKVAEWIGFSGLFWACGVCTLAYTLLVVLFIPETKGKSLTEISKYFERYQKSSEEVS